MKKLLGIVVLGLFLSGNAFSKIDNQYYNLLYGNCVYNAEYNKD